MSIPYGIIKHVYFLHWRQKMRKLTLAVILLLTAFILTSCGISQEQVDAIADELIETQKELQNCKGETESILQYIGDASGITTTIPRENAPTETRITGIIDDTGHILPLSELQKTISISPSDLEILFQGGMITLDDGRKIWMESSTYILDQQKSKEIKVVRETRLMERIGEVLLHYIPIDKNADDWESERQEVTEVIMEELLRDYVPMEKFDEVIETALLEHNAALQKAADEYSAARKAYEEEIDTARREYEEQLDAANQEYEEALADFNKVAYHLAYEVMESEWLSGNVEGEYAVTNMEKQLVGLGNEELLSLWEAYLAAETEQESMDKALEFNAAYYEEMNELMDSAIEKYGILGY
jgi:hypothetical protein